MAKQVTLTSTGAQQSWTVPSDISGSVITVELWGATGNDPTVSGIPTPGIGGYVKGDVPGMAAGQVVYFNIGKQGKAYNGGWPNGGDAPSVSGGGGGSTDLRVGGTGQAQQFMVAAGGGGGHLGGNGGAATGQDGHNGADTACGHGGTQTAGGAGGAGRAGISPGYAGARNKGGQGSGGTYQGNEGGGGGGGYYGGGGGGGTSNGGSSGFPGGGGSNWVGGCLIGGISSAPTNTTSSRGVSTPAAVTNGDGYVRITYTTAPNAPTITSPKSNSSFDQALGLEIDWTPDASSAGIASSDIQWRQGSGAWTSIHQANANNNYVFASNMFTAYTDQQIEIQVRQIDVNGKVGSWSASLFVYPRQAPAAPTATFPTEIQSQTQSVSVSAGAIIQAEVQSTTDVAGAAGTVLEDATSQTFSPASTDATVQLPSYAYVNGTSYHLRARIANPAGVWSPWTDSGALATSINAPLAPTLTLTPQPDTGSVQILVNNPGSDPYPPSSNNVYRTDLATGIETLISTGVAPNSSITDWMVGFNRSYRYRAEAVGVNGAITSST